MNIVTKYDLHQTVTIKELDTEAVIISFEMAGVLLYKVQYWLNGEQKYAWCFEDDLS